MPGQPTFDEFFQGAFQRALGAVQIPGTPDASWDRKAAYLLWRATQEGTALRIAFDAPTDKTTISPEDVFG